MTLVLRIFEKNIERILDEFIISHDRDEIEVIMGAFHEAEAEIPDLVSDPHFFLQISRNNASRDMVRLGRGLISKKTAKVILFALEASKKHAFENDVSAALMNLDTIH